MIGRCIIDSTLIPGYESMCRLVSLCRYLSCYRVLEVQAFFPPSLPPPSINPARHAWLRHRWPEWRGGKGHLLEDRFSLHRPPPPAQAQIPHGCGVRDAPRVRGCAIARRCDSVLPSRFPVDLVVCCALGVDMFDCVFPTRTAVS